MLTLDTIKTNQRVTYLHSYGDNKPVTQFPAIVVKRHPILIRIAVYNAYAKKVMYKNVRHYKLLPRIEHASIDDQHIKEFS